MDGVVYETTLPYIPTFKYVPKKRSYPPDDDFFTEGNIEAKGWWLNTHHKIPSKEIDELKQDLV